MTAPFEFRQSAMVLRSTGRKAEALGELRDLIATVSPESIVHHTYHYFMKGHVLDYTNDFAQWAGESIEESVLAEQLSNVDLYDYPDVESLRKELLSIIDRYRERFPEPRAALPRDEFFFNEAVTLVFSTGLAARNLAEFLIAIKHVDTGSLYYHFYDARIRQNGSNDFSQWFERELGKIHLAERVQEIDPFMHSLEGIRELTARAVEDELKKDMQVAGTRHDRRLWD